MEKEQFVAVDTEPWWLVQRDVDYRLEELRRRLGASFGWTDPLWYTERFKLEEVWLFLQEQGSTVLYELEQASDDDRRQRWVESVLELKKPAESGPPKSSSPDSVPAQSVGGTSTPSAAGSAWPANGARPRRSAFGAKPASEASDPTAGTRASVPAPPVRRSAFGSQRQPEPSAATADARGPAPTAVPAATPPARKSPFLGKRQQEPSGQGAEAGRTAASIHTARTDAPVRDLDEQIKAVVTALSTADLSAIAAELGVTPEEVKVMTQEDDFADLVAQARVQLAS